MLTILKKAGGHSESLKVFTLHITDGWLRPQRPPSSPSRFIKQRRAGWLRRRPATQLSGVRTERKRESHWLGRCSGSWCSCLPGFVCDAISGAASWCVAGAPHSEGGQVPGWHRGSERLSHLPKVTQLGFKPKFVFLRGLQLPHTRPHR